MGDPHIWNEPEHDAKSLPSQVNDCSLGLFHRGKLATGGLRMELQCGVGLAHALPG
jgi:hypothetical protein